MAENTLNYEADEGVEEEIAGESKADKFIRLANKRTNNAIKQITGIGKLSTSAYEYTDDQIVKIFDALQTTLDTARSKFEKKKDDSNTFQL